MSDLLSQEEIDALLNGIGPETDAAAGVAPTATSAPPVTAASPQDAQPNPTPQPPASGSNIQEMVLTPEEADVLGEVGNISMGASATALSQLISQAVNITTPVVSVMSFEELMQQYPKPYIVAAVTFTEGLMGTNLLIININDIKILTNLMMGEPVGTDADKELSELQLSAISEAMNQMIGSSCTSISTMISKKIDITPPNAQYVDFAEKRIPDVFSELQISEKIVKISFRMVVGDLIDSEIMQLLPLEFAKDLVKNMFSSGGAAATSIKAESLEQFNQPIIEQQPAPPQYELQPQYAPQPQPQYAPPQPQYQEPIYAAPPQMNYAMPPMPEPPRTPVNVQPAQFQSLDDPHFMGYKENIGLIMDVPLQVQVELGRATKMIREILEFGPGSIVELDKLAGEPVDILVNGKIIAKGEVVVIDESFGVRITDIVHPSKRI